ncbi:unnamed protein product [Rhizophagus irregularis]|uniref:Uncharacterized protein n=2 Tax=Rhizophagus irregularis TaxID=588596 RepID=A0A915ZQZ2_9GLOM|nr:unnamed protein product [Rhizophagus irregularis]
MMETYETLYNENFYQGIIQREAQQHQTSFLDVSTYVPSEIIKNIQDSENETLQLQQHQISHNSIIQQGSVDMVIQSIVNFYAEKLHDSNSEKVTYSIVKQCLTKYSKNENTYEPEPELFIEISKSIGHTTYDKSYYKNDGIKCSWDDKATNDLKLIVKKYKYLELYRYNKASKTGFWECVCFKLSKHGYNYTPPQCVVKYKNYIREIKPLNEII